MITGSAFLCQTENLGFNFYSGVPCSFLTPLINGVISNETLSYVGATNEGEALAIASGAWLAGKKSVVMCQNSGLGNLINPLTSLNTPFGIPTLLIVTWRGQPGLSDEPQHNLMGRITTSMLDVIKIPHTAFPQNIKNLSTVLQNADISMTEKNLPFALILEKGVVEPQSLTKQKLSVTRIGKVKSQLTRATPPSRYDALNTLLSNTNENAAIIATTGKTGRELFTISDRKQHFYQVGSMGCAAAMGLGVALNTNRPVIIIDGDGSSLMKLGTLGTIGAYAPRNLIHLILDNGVHDSTGGQPTVSQNVSFAKTAQSCGYKTSYACDTLDSFAAALKDGTLAAKPCLIHLKIKPGSMTKLGRPTISPFDVARRFRDFINS